MRSTDHPTKHCGLNLGLLRCGKTLIYPSSTNNKAALQLLKKKASKLNVDLDMIPLLESMDYVDFSRKTI
jgi:hypothetical protein